MLLHVIGGRDLLTHTGKLGKSKRRVHSRFFTDLETKVLHRRRNTRACIVFGNNIPSEFTFSSDLEAFKLYPRDMARLRRLVRDVGRPPVSTQVLCFFFPNVTCFTV